MYRILEASREVRERRNQLRHPSYAKPELLATAPNQVWSWDITKLLGPVKWTYFYLYVILDIFNRYGVGWSPAMRRVLAKKLIQEALERQNILPGQLTIRADRGSSMKSKPVALLLSDLGVTKTHSRPYACDEIPIRRLSLRPSSTVRISRSGLGVCRMRGGFVRVFSAGITPSITIRGLA